MPPGVEASSTPAPAMIKKTSAHEDGEDERSDPYPRMPVLPVGPAVFLPIILHALPQTLRSHP